MTVGPRYHLDVGFAPLATEGCGGAAYRDGPQAEQARALAVDHRRRPAQANALLVASSVRNHEVGDNAVGLAPGSGHVRRPAFAQSALQAPQQCLSDKRIMLRENAVPAVLPRKRLCQRNELAAVVQTAADDRQCGHELAFLFVQVASEQGTNVRRDLE